MFFCSKCGAVVQNDAKICETGGTVTGNASIINEQKIARSLPKKTVITVIVAVTVLCVGCGSGSNGTFVDGRDGRSYNIVKIGSQTWMAENLDIYVEGSKCYNNSPDSCEKYGRLYNWNTAKTACPAGWHLPTVDEWAALENAVGGWGKAGTKLKASTDWRIIDGVPTGKNKYGFSALPGGNGDGGGYFYGVGINGNWWTATENATNTAYFWGMLCNDEMVSRLGHFVITDYLSIRCLKDSPTSQEAITPQPITTLADSRDGSGNQQPITTFLDKRDGKSYRKVTIGKQTWLAENLNYAAKGSFCLGDNNENCAKYGRLYNWSTAKTACPVGWHLPTDDEWAVLENAVGGSSTAGTRLKSTSGWNRNGNGTNDYGFSALPGGIGNGSGNFHSAGDDGVWWSATEDGASDAWYRDMDYNYEFVGRDNYGKSYLFSVRCVQNID